MSSRRVDLINLHDYPRSKYLVYWEIRVKGEEEGAYEYGVRFYSYDTNRVVKETMGGADNRDEADTLAQQWVIDHIEQYRR